MLDTGCWILDAGYWMLDTGCWTILEELKAESSELKAEGKRYNATSGFKKLNRYSVVGAFSGQRLSGFCKKFLVFFAQDLVVNCLIRVET